MAQKIHELSPSYQRRIAKQLGPYIDINELIYKGRMEVNGEREQR